MKEYELIIESYNPCGGREHGKKELMEIPSHIRVYEATGPMFFGAANQIEEINFKVEGLVVRERLGINLNLCKSLAPRSILEKLNVPYLILYNGPQTVFVHVPSQSASSSIPHYSSLTTNI